MLISQCQQNQLNALVSILVRCGLGFMREPQWISRYLLRLVVLLVLAVSVRPAQADFINGSFEDPVVGQAGILVIGAGNEPAAFGWTVTAGTVEVQGQLYASLPGPAFHGTQFLDLNGISVGSISQTFATTAGQQYRIDFAYASNYTHNTPLDPATALVRIVDGVSGSVLLANQALSHGTSSAANLDWKLASFDITATGNSTMLVFESTRLTKPFGGILLDGVSVNAVPEPASGVLLTVASLIFISRRIGRRKSLIAEIDS